MDIVKISLLGICGVMLGFFLKGTRPEYAALVTAGDRYYDPGTGGRKLEYLFEAVSRLKEKLPEDNGHLSTLIKMVGLHISASSLRESAETRGIRQQRDRLNCSANCP